MRISVITVVLNRRDKIAATLDSVLGQEWDDLEVIVVDGHSTDGTLDVVRHYGNRIDRLLIEPARGIYQAMNLGVQAATGEWIIFMNAGDVFADMTVLQRVESALYEGPPLVCGGFITQWGRHTVTSTARPLGVGLIPSCHQAMFMRTESARRHPFDVSLRVGADYDQVCRIAPRAGDIVMTDVVIARVEGEGFSSSNRQVAHRNYRDIIARHHGWLRAWVWYFETTAWTIITGVLKRIVPSATIANIRRLRARRRRPW